MDAGPLSPDLKCLRARESIAGHAREMAQRSKVTLNHRMRRQEPLHLIN
jgi:hypothetical protein